MDQSSKHELTFEDSFWDFVHLKGVGIHEVELALTLVEELALVLIQLCHFNHVPRSVPLRVLGSC